MWFFLFTLTFVLGAVTVPLAWNLFIYKFVSNPAKIRGREEGEAEGLYIGKKLGRIIGRLDLLSALVAMGRMDEARAAEIAGISVEAFRKYEEAYRKNVEELKDLFSEIDDFNRAHSEE